MVTGYRILILEDLATDAELAERELRQAQIAFTSRRVETRADYLRELEQFAPDVILADYNLPQFTALEALQLLKQRGRPIPFILVTGSQSEEVAAACMKEGASDYMLKSSLKRLPSAVLNAMEKREAEREREAAETALRRSEEQYRVIAENTRDLICLLDREGNFLYLSPSYREVLGYAPEDLLGRDAFSLVHPEDQVAMQAAFQAALLDQGSRRVEYRYQHQSGGWRNFESVGNWILNEQGAPYQAVVVSRDITEGKRAEEALRKSETTNRALLDAIPDLMFRLSRQGIYLDFKAAKGLDPLVPPEKFLGKKVAEVMPAEVAKQAMHYVEQALHTGRTQIFEYQLLANNQPGDFEARIVACGKDEVLAIVRDITERKRAEQALRQSKQQYEELVNTIDGIVWEADAQTFRFSFVSQQAERLLGYPLERWLAEPDFWEKHIHPDDREWAVRFCLEATQEKRDHEFEYRMMAADGRIVWLHDTVALVVGNDRAAKLRGIMVDVTERKRAEERLVESENRLRAVIESEPECVKLTAADGTLLEMNPAGLAMIEADSAEQVVGQSVYPIVAPEYRAAYQALTERVFRGDSGTLEFEIIGLKGTRRWLVTHAAPLRNARGEIAALLSVTRDITESRRLEEQFRQSQKMEAIGRLAGGVAHDFNNLLTAINGYSELLLRRAQQDDPLRRYLEDIKKAGERAASLTRQLLAFSRKQVLQLKVIDLNAVVAEMEKLLRRLIGEDIELVTALDPALGLLKADPGQIEQVIMNLVVNARDAMPQGGQLRIETANVALPEGLHHQRFATQPGSYVLLIVRDTGCGMDAETQSHIFEPFFTTKGVGQGTGLGLSMVYGIVKQSGGYIVVESEVDKGATFKIYLPRIAEASAAAEPEAPAEESLAGSETVLLVEDEEIVRRLVLDILQGSGYHVLEARRGSEAIELCQRHPDPIHLMLTDVVMPQMSGRELANRVAPLRPEMKVIYMSGYTDDAIVHHGVLDANTAFLQKPFTPDALVRKLREALDAERKDKG
jgi:PAS domain S-box-containing protein